MDKGARREFVSNLVFVRLAAFVILLLGLFQPLVANATNNEAVAAFIKSTFASKVKEASSEALARNHEIVKAFYATRNFKPIWTRDSGPKGKGKALLQELKRSPVHGLSPGFYQVDKIENLMIASKPEDIARLDLLLSGAFIDYAHDLRNGRIGNFEKSSTNKVTPVRISADELISGAADSGNLRGFASAFLNADERYVRLLAKYVEYDRIKKSGQWPKLEPSGKSIGKGQKDKRMKAIRTLLLLSGDLAFSAADGGDRHDKDTQEAVRSFQSYNGLQVDGAIGAQTLAALATPPQARMDQILINLERRRWQNKELGETHIYANLADRSARMVVDGKKAGFLKILPTKELKKTPTFYGRVTQILLDKQGEQDAVLMISGDENQISIEMPVSFLGGNSAKDYFGTIAEGIGNSGDAKQLTVNNPVEIFVTYVTAWANKDGKVNFRPDIFARDQKLKELLLSPEY